MKKIECKYCGWSWNENEGGDDKYTCHMCGNDNAEHYLNESQEDKSTNQYNKDGEKNGPWVEYYPNGKDILFKGSYKNGEKDGDWVFYYMNGNVELEGSFKNGEKDGVWAQYYRDGNLIRKELYSNGEYVRRISLKESETPKKKLFVPRKLSGEDSRWVMWNKDQPIVNGKPINQYDMDGLKQGYWEEYEEDDNSIQKGSYKDGKEEGIWEYFYPNGQISMKGSYKNGVRYGIWEFYWENGNLMYKGSYKNGLKDGMWEYYHKNGNLWEKQLYDNGKLVKELPLKESETS